MDSHSFLSAFGQPMDESSSSTSPSTTNSFSSYFASDQLHQPAIMAASAVAAMMPQPQPQPHVDTADSSPAIILGCDVYPCCGGSFTVSGFQACEKRPANLKQKLHGRGMVCPIHHEYVKCQSCRLHAHVGCFVPQNTGYKQLHRGYIWTCQKCTLHDDSKCTLKSDVTAAAGLECKSDVTAAAGLDCEIPKSKTGTKCIFPNRQQLVQHARELGWSTRSSHTGSPRIYFVCQKSQTRQADGKPAGCAVTFNARAYSICAVLPEGISIEDVEWCAVNMPTQHECCKQVLQTALTTSVCRLPRDVYKDIQRLACCKAFNSQSIQQYIKMTYPPLIVDVNLIYNIGYRARTKIGIGDVGLLLQQQTVRVYTSTSLLRILTQIAETTC